MWTCTPPLPVLLRVGPGLGVQVGKGNDIVSVPPSRTQPRGKVHGSFGCGLFYSNPDRMYPSGCCATESTTSHGFWPRVCPDRDSTFALHALPVPSRDLGQDLGWPTVLPHKGLHPTASVFKRPQTCRRGRELYFLSTIGIHRLLEVRTYRSPFGSGLVPRQNPQVLLVSVCPPASFARDLAQYAKVLQSSYCLADRWCCQVEQL